MKIAVIDLGTNTFHLLIVDVTAEGKWKKFLHKRITVKLGQGGISKNIISKAPYKRGVNAIKKFKSVIDLYKIKSVSAFGTAALRGASNGPEFLREIRNDYGINVKLISGKEEAGFIYQGVRQAVKLYAPKSLIMDIGGGSVEFIIANDSKAFWKGSYKLGAAFLLEKFAPSNPILDEEIKRINSYLDKELFSLIEACKNHKPVQIIGSAGSFETFSSMIHHRFPESGSHYGKTEHPINIKHFQQLHKALMKSSINDRKNMKGLIKMRVDMIVLAALMLNFVLKRTGINKIKMSAYSLKEGTVLYAINKI